MSFEYAIATSTRPDLGALSKRLEAYGLVPADGSGLAFNWAATRVERSDSWGPDVQMLQEGEGLLLTILVGAHKAILSEVIDELSRQGVFVSVDEP